MSFCNEVHVFTVRLLPQKCCCKKNKLRVLLFFMHRPRPAHLLGCTLLPETELHAFIALSGKSFNYLVISWETSTTTGVCSVFYTRFNKRLIRLNTKSKQKPARKNCSFFYYCVTLYPDLPVFAYPKKVSNRPKDQKCCTSINLRLKK